MLSYTFTLYTNVTVVGASCKGSIRYYTAARERILSPSTIITINLPKSPAKVGIGSYCCTCRVESLRGYFNQTMICIDVPYLWYPSCPQTTWLSSRPKPLLHTVAHAWLLQTSSRPLLADGPSTSLASPLVQFTISILFFAVSVCMQTYKT